VAQLGPDIDALDSEREPPPRLAALGAVGWAKRHLFSSTVNTVLTIVTVIIVVLLIRGVASFVLGDRPKWGSVTSNMRLYMVFAYPKDQMLRVWLSVGIVFSLFGLTFAAWGGGTRISIQKVTGTFMKIGAVFATLGFVAGPVPIVWDDPPISLQSALILIAAGTSIAVAGYLIRRATGDADQISISKGMLLAVWSLIAVAIIWLIRVPTPAHDSAGNYIEPLKRLALTTTVPLTVMAIVMMLSFFLGMAAVKRWSEGRVRGVLIALWVVSYPLIVFVILRAPDVDWDQFWRRDVWITLGFVVFGGLLVAFIADPAKPGRGRVIGILFTVFTAAMFWPLGIGGLIRNLMVITAVVAIVAPSFSGEGARKRIVATYAGIIVIAAFFLIAIDTTMSFSISKESFLGGLFLTIILAIAGLALAFPLAILVALGRQSKMPIFRQLSIGYIELVRGVPLIVWLIMGISLFGFFVPRTITPDAIVRVLAAFTFFWAAYLAENIRGGLQAIGKGQTEAANALGMTTFQTTVFIVLPQALRLVIPPIVGQVITSFKDTSLVAIVGVFELLNVATAVPQQTDPFKFLGTASENLLFVAVVYWLFTSTISRSSRRIETKLGVGTR